jgi:hypothetical protein
MVGWTLLASSAFVSIGSFRLERGGGPALAYRVDPEPFSMARDHPVGTYAMSIPEYTRVQSRFSAANRGAMEFRQ